MNYKMMGWLASPQAQASLLAAYRSFNHLGFMTVPKVQSDAPHRTFDAMTLTDGGVRDYRLLVESLAPLLERQLASTPGPQPRSMPFADGTWQTSIYGWPRNKWGSMSFHRPGLVDPLAPLPNQISLARTVRSKLETTVGIESAFHYVGARNDVWDLATAIEAVRNLHGDDAPREDGSIPGESLIASAKQMAETVPDPQRILQLRFKQVGLLEMGALGSELANLEDRPLTDMAQAFLSWLGLSCLPEGCRKDVRELPSDGGELSGAMEVSCLIMEGVLSFYVEDDLGNRHHIRSVLQTSEDGLTILSESLDYEVTIGPSLLPVSIAPKLERAFHHSIKRSAHYLSQDGVPMESHLDARKAVYSGNVRSFYEG